MAAPKKPTFFFKVAHLHLWAESSVDWWRSVKVGGGFWWTLVAEVGGGRWRRSVEVGGVQWMSVEVEGGHGLEVGGIRRGWRSVEVGG